MTVLVKRDHFAVYKIEFSLEVKISDIVNHALKIIFIEYQSICKINSIQCHTCFNAQNRTEKKIKHLADYERRMNAHLFIKLLQFTTLK